MSGGAEGVAGYVDENLSDVRAEHSDDQRGVSVV